MASVDISKIVIGDPLKCIVKVKSQNNFQREDIRIVGGTVSITDSNNRVMEEFDVSDAFGSEIGMPQIFESVYKLYVNPFIQGYSCSFFFFGTTGSGKSSAIEGNMKEPGLVTLIAESVFHSLEAKKYQSNQSRQGGITNFAYAMRMRMVEIIDEEVNDLFRGGGRLNSMDSLNVVESAWEGPTIQNGTWITIQNASQVNEIVPNALRNRNQGSNEFGKLQAKSSTIIFLELLQTFYTQDSRDQQVLLSRLNIFDLPGSEILADDPETIRIRQGSTLNKSIVALSSLIKDLSAKRNDFVLYHNSVLTHLMKDALGGNSLTVGMFCLQNGDPRGSALTLNFLKYARNIFNFPIVNNQNAIGLLKKFRVEAIAYKNNKGSDNYLGIGADVSGLNNLVNQNGLVDNARLIELEKKLIENHLEKMKQADDKQRLAAKLTELREKFNLLIKEKGDLQGDLIRAEEEKLEVSKALVELQIENTRLLEIVQNEKYDANTKLLNAEQDRLDLNVREEQALKTVQELQDKLREVLEDKRELEMEFVALKKNYIFMNQQLEEEKLKNQNIGMELINMVNENKALHDEMNDVYKKTGATTDENQRFMNKLEKMDKENQEQREALVFAKAEIERLKTELLKYDIMEQQHRMELDSKKLDMEKGFLEVTKEKQNEFSKMNKEVEVNLRRVREEKLLWESQKMELTHKNKLAQRKIIELEDRIRDLQKAYDEINSENNKLNLQMDEKTSIFRNKLLQFTAEQAKGGKDKPTRIGYDLNAREELIRTYTEKEIELNERLEREKRNYKVLNQEKLALMNWARQLKYLAEDWAPVGIPLPEILVKDPPVKLEGDFVGYQAFNMGNGDSTQEVERLRQQNRKLNEDVRVLQEQLQQTQNQRNQNDPDISRRLMQEIDNLKGQPDILKRPGTSSVNVEQLRRERNELQEENRRLVAMLKDNKKLDIYLLQRDNERLLKVIRDMENGENQGVGPVSGGQTGSETALKQKVAFYEKNLKQLEKERSELMVRATMAEEQLKSLQEHLGKVTLDYQKKMQELKKQGARY